MIRFMTYAIAIAALLYSAAGLAMYLFQRPILFMNGRDDITPAEAGLPEATVQHLRTSDDVRLVTWLVRGSGKLLAMYFHGNAGSLAVRAERIRQLASLGFSVLAVEYRGFGGSEGQPSEQGLNRDADAAYGYARSIGFGGDRIVLYGESLGTGVATQLAARSKVAGVILDAPFSSVADVAADRYWMFPVRWLLRDPFRSDLAIGKVKVPVLILHGDRDGVVPIRYGRRLAALGGANVTFVTVENGEHMVLGEAEPEVRQWMSGLQAASSPASPPGSAAPVTATR